MSRATVATLIAVTLIGAAGCGDDEKSGEPSNAAPPATAPEQDKGGATVRQKDSAIRTEPSDRSTPEAGRLGTEFRERLRQSAEGQGGGFTGSDVISVRVGRTSATVLTKLGRDAREGASTICAEVRRYLAQEPSGGSAATVTVVGGDRSVLTRC